MRRLSLSIVVALATCLPWAEPAQARNLASQVLELNRIPSVRPEFPVPSEPNQLFYIQRSVNANTVVYTAHFDSNGRIDAGSPVDAYWRWYNVDGHRKSLNFLERTMAYGVQKLAAAGGNSIAVRIAALPERKLLVDQDDKGQPEALIQIGNRLAKLVYVYLQVDESGLMPSVTSMDLFGLDKGTGKALREHVVPD
jgi:hypothetical protein